jgi:hypothetical protein
VEGGTIVVQQARPMVDNVFISDHWSHAPMHTATVLTIDLQRHTPIVVH